MAKTILRKGEKVTVTTKKGRVYEGVVTMDLQDYKENQLYIDASGKQHVFCIEDVAGLEMRKKEFETVDAALEYAKGKGTIFSDHQKIYWYAPGISQNTIIVEHDRGWIAPVRHLERERERANAAIFR